MNARAAAAAGVSPEIVFVDAADGLMLTRFVDGAVTMSPELFRSRSRCAAAAPAGASAGCTTAASASPSASSCSA